MKNEEDTKDLKEIKVKCVKSFYDDDFTVGTFYKMTCEGIRDNDNYLWDDFLYEKGDTLLDKWKNACEDIIFEEIVEKSFNIKTKIITQNITSDNYSVTVYPDSGNFSLNYSGVGNAPLSTVDELMAVLTEINRLAL